jgi:SdpI/YfhL protein family
MLRLLFIGLPAFAFLAGIPLALRLVPPNRFYGYRTATSFASLEAWYELNWATGVALIAAGIVGAIAVLLLAQGIFSLKPEARYLTGVLVTLALIAFLIPVVIYSNKF